MSLINEIRENSNCIFFSLSLKYTDFRKLNHRFLLIFIDMFNKQKYKRQNPVTICFSMGFVQEQYKEVLVYSILLMTNAILGSYFCTVCIFKVIVLKVT